MSHGLFPDSTLLTNSISLGNVPLAIPVRVGLSADMARFSATAPHSPAAPLNIPLHYWASLHSELLWAYEGPVSQSVNVTSDHRVGYWVWLLRKGACEIVVEKKRWQAKAGEWIVSPHGITTQTFAPDTSILSIHFRCQWPTGDNLFTGNSGLIFGAEKYPQLERAGMSLQRLVSRHFPGINRQHLSVQNSTYRLFWQLQRAFAQWMMEFADAMIRNGRYLAHGGECEPRVQRAIECLNKSPLDEPFPAVGLQTATGLGRARLDYLFWKQVGVHTREYWNKLKVQSATQSLEESNLSIKEIGYKVGFKQASHFTNWFRLQSGRTPRDHRSQATQKRKVGVL